MSNRHGEPACSGGRGSSSIVPTRFTVFSFRTPVITGERQAISSLRLIVGNGLVLSKATIGGISAAPSRGPSRLA